MLLKKTANSYPEDTSKTPGPLLLRRSFFFLVYVVWWGFSWHKEWEILEKAETELTGILYSVLRNGFGQYNTESYWGHEDGQRF